MKSNIKHSLLLVLAALIWGVAFVPQKAGGDAIGGFTFNAIRSFLGGIVLIPVIFLFGKKRKKEDIKGMLVGGICCGVMLFFGSSFQQMGLVHNAEAGKAGFITALYIVLVPIFGLFGGKKNDKVTILSVIIAICGMYFLCVSGKLSVGLGEILVLICAPFFALHILTVDFFVKKYDGVKLSCIQFFTCGILSLIPMFLLEEPTCGEICQAWLPILYTGVMSSGVAYTLQIVGQKNVKPAVASILLSLESVFAVLAGMVLLGEELSCREAFGCVLMFAAIILTQLPRKVRSDE